MILLTGAINDINKKIVFIHTTLVWIEPTTGMDLPMVNEFCNRLLEVESNDLVLWTNNYVLINGVHFTELWLVEDGILLKKPKEHIRSSQLSIGELVCRNWIFR